jgi:hypothetical protein
MREGAARCSGYQTGLARDPVAYRRHRGDPLRRLGRGLPCKGSPPPCRPVTPRVISAYLSGDLPLWQLSGNQLVITRRGTIVVDDLDQEIDQALTVARLLDSRPS